MSCSRDKKAVGGDGCPNPSQAINFLTLCERLKTTKRTGWVRKGVHLPESIADHMYRMAIMSLIAPFDESIDRNRCMQIALVHDLAEAIVGDITPHCGISDEEKYKREADAIDAIRDMLGGGLTGSHIKSLWQEYETGTTPEARMVKDFDKLEMILQASEYERGQQLSLAEFFASTQGKFKTDVGKAWAAEICRKREEEAAAEAAKEGTSSPPYCPG
eukprot:jgi/Mesvir1/2052/Mv02314-RA.1